MLLLIACKAGACCPAPVLGCDAATSCPGPSKSMRSSSQPSPAPGCDHCRFQPAPAGSVAKPLRRLAPEAPVCLAYAHSSCRPLCSRVCPATTPRGRVSAASGWGAQLRLQQGQHAQVNSLQPILAWRWQLRALTCASRPTSISTGMTQVQPMQAGWPTAGAPWPAQHRPRGARRSQAFTAGALRAGAGGQQAKHR